MALPVSAMNFFVSSPLAARLAKIVSAALTMSGANWETSLSVNCWKIPVSVVILSAAVPPAWASAPDRRTPICSSVEEY